MFFNKICPICSKSFQCKKISTLFCSKKCNNRTRYLPKHLIQELVRRNNNYTYEANNFTAITRDESGVMNVVGYKPEGATEEHPLGKEEGFLIGTALIMREERDARLREKQKHNGGFNTVDTPQEVNEISDELDRIDKLLEQEEQVHQVSLTPPKSKIRRIGEKHVS